MEKEMSKELFEKLNAKFFELEELKTDFCKIIYKFNTYYEDICKMCSTEKMAFCNIKEAANQALSSAILNISSTSKALFYHMVDFVEEEEKKNKKVKEAK